ncbi:SGNH/GDSL hydrolase family protein [Roseobacter sp. YSTF-M11]|uniref:SGNH/GDSL hydrolase family protein n=1 Tax=Roseobacter insulae TaxID=2859783 RepID=A0A9X1FZ29_9RHOB|nr:SGNH/GDSL hydrolase family protein [Roseobacter insulae]MBW4710012.1 SGNH/GDSL hydrolase family protein [Roseobacter insulae]
MAPRTVLCFGDSNTHGTLAMRSNANRPRLAGAERWPSVMAQALGADWEVIAEGHPGRTAVFDDPIDGLHKNGLRSLHAILESHRPIDLVVVMLGTNDLKSHFGASAFDIAAGLGRLAKEIRRCDSGPDGTAPAVLLAAPVPVLETGIFVDSFAGAAEKSRQLPRHLRKVARELSVGCIDLAQVAQVDPVDGVHLDAKSHHDIGLAMADAVKAELRV